MLIKVYGPGCTRCKSAFEVMKSAAKETQTEATVEKVSDLKEILFARVMGTPAVSIDGKVVCSGHVPSRREAIAWLEAAKSTNSDREEK